MGTNRGSVSRREHKEVAHLGTPWWGAATIAELRLPLPCLTTVTVEARGTHDCTVMVPVLSQTSLCTFLSVKELGKIIQFPLFTVAARMLGEEISSPIQILWGMTFSSRKTKAVVEFPPKDAGQPKQSQMVTTYTRLAAQYQQNSYPATIFEHLLCDWLSFRGLGQWTKRKNSCWGETLGRWAINRINKDIVCYVMVSSMGKIQEKET